MLQYSKEDSSEYIKDRICSNNTSCQNYLKSTDNMVSAGFESAVKNCYSLNNIFLHYQKLKNKTDINEIISTITGPEFYE